MLKWFARLSREQFLPELHDFFLLSELRKVRYCVWCSLLAAFELASFEYGDFEATDAVLVNFVVFGPEQIPQRLLPSAQS